MFFSTLKRQNWDWKYWNILLPQINQQDWKENTGSRKNFFVNISSPKPQTESLPLHFWWPTRCHWHMDQTQQPKANTKIKHTFDISWTPHFQWVLTCLFNDYHVSVLLGTPCFKALRMLNVICVGWGDFFFEIQDHHHHCDLWTSSHAE